jgi:hypothetical protein
MSRPKLPATCTVCATNLSRANRCQELGMEDMCATCYEAGGLENEHSDRGHPTPVDNCPACGTTKESIAMTDTTKTVLAPTVGRLYFNHEACTHASTPAARAKCRKDGAAATFRADNGITRLEVVPEQATTKSPKVKTPKVKAFRAVHSHLSGMVIHWATKDDADVLVPACGAKLKQPTEVKATESKGCAKCRVQAPTLKA